MPAMVRFSRSTTIPTLPPATELWDADEEVAYDPPGLIKAPALTGGLGRAALPVPAVAVALCHTSKNCLLLLHCRRPAQVAPSLCRKLTAGTTAEEAAAALAMAAGEPERRDRKSVV